jgi:hypothetical protein
LKPNGFEITFAIADDEWARSARLRSDPESEPVFDCFYGLVQISAEGITLFTPRPLQLSVADLACSLALRLDEGFLGADSARDARFRQADDALEIKFHIAGETVRVSANHTASQVIETGPASCQQGILRFLEDFAAQLIMRVPEPFEWKDLAVLKRYGSPGAERVLF